MSDNRVYIVVLIALVVSLVYSCAAFRQELYYEGGTDERFHNAIVDFIHTEHNLLKEDNLFHVFSYEDSLSVCIIGDSHNKFYYLLIIPDWSIMSDRWYADSIIVMDTTHNKAIVIVDESVSPSTIWYDEDAVRGSYELFPNGVYEFGEKLFYWYSDVPRDRSQELIEMVYHHSVVDTLVDKIMWPEYAIDDRGKGKVYTFSRDNLRKYKKNNSLFFH